jgi:hypothetical protein
MKLSIYLKNFGRLLGSLTALIGAFPFIGNYFANNYLYISPPIKTQFLLIYLILFVTCIVSIYFFKEFDLWKLKWGVPSVITILFMISIIAFFIFFYWSQAAVRSIFLPDQNKSIYVIVGTERTQFALNEFSVNDSDEDLLHNIGYLDEDIRRLWTKESIYRSRIYVAGSYFLLLLCLTTIFSIWNLKLCISKQ